MKPQTVGCLILTVVLSASVTGQVEHAPTGSPEAAGTAAALLAQIMGIAAGIQQIWKSKHNTTNP